MYWFVGLVEEMHKLTMENFGIFYIINHLFHLCYATVCCFFIFVFHFFLFTISMNVLLLTDLVGSVAFLR